MVHKKLISKIFIIVILLSTIFRGNMLVFAESVSTNAVEDLLSKEVIEVSDKMELLTSYKEEQVQKLEDSMQKKDEVSQIVREELKVDVGGSVDKGDIERIKEAVDNGVLGAKEKKILEESGIVDFVKVYDEEKEEVLEKVYDPTIVSDGEYLSTKSTSYEVKINIDDYKEESGSSSIVSRDEVSESMEIILPKEIVNEEINTEDVIYDYSISIEDIGVNKESEMKHIDDKILYKDYYEGIDKIQSMEKDGVKEDLIVKKKGNKGYHVFLYKVNTKNLSPIETKNGGIDFIDSNSGSVMYMPAPFFTDVNGKSGLDAYFEILHDVDLSNIDSYYNIGNVIKGKIFRINESIKENFIKTYNQEIFDENNSISTGTTAIDSGVSILDNFINKTYANDEETISEDNMDYWRSVFEDNTSGTVSGKDIVVEDANLGLSYINSGTSLESNIALELLDADLENDIIESNDMLDSNYWKNIISNNVSLGKDEYLIRLVVLVSDSYVYPIDIDPTIKIRLFAYDSDMQYAYGENIGYIATYNPFVEGLNVYDDYIKGWLWSNSIGWIKLNSAMYDQGPYPNTGTGDYGVNIAVVDQSNPYISRVLTGYALSENIGWISFSNDADGSITEPTLQDGTDYGVYISSGGMMQGYAWSNIAGWIAFNYSGVNVRLDEVVASVSTGNSLVSHITDVDHTYTGALLLTYYGISTNPCTSTGYGVDTWYTFTSSTVLEHGDGYICYKMMYGTGVNYTEYYYASDIVVWDDTTSPLSTASVITGTLGQNGWYTTSAEVEIVYSDDKSGVASTKYCIDTSNSCTADATYTGNISISSNGQSYIRYNSFDNVGNIETTKSLEVKIDISTPDIVAVDSGPNNGDRTSFTSDIWANTGTDISFSWTDSNSPSDDVFYYELNTTSSNDQIDGTESNVTTNYVDNITVLEGNSYFHVRPRSNAGIWGVERVFILKYDISLPAMTAVNDHGPISPDLNLIFSWTGTDLISGFSGSELCLSTTQSMPCIENIFTASSTGYTWTGGAWGTTYYASVRGFDNAGNVSSWSLWSDGVTPDANAPTVYADMTNTGSWYNTGVNITIYGDDAESGISQIKYRWDALADESNGTVVSSGTQIAFNIDGSHILYLWAKDNANNTSTWSGSYNLDSIAPVVDASTITYPNGGESFGGGSELTVTWDNVSVIDTVSGFLGTPITLSYSTGSTWNVIVQNTANDGSFDWTLPDISSTGMIVRLTATDVAGNDAYDISDDIFSITSSSNLNTLTKISGDNQLADMYDIVRDDIVVRVGNDFGSYASSGAVTVIFSIIDAPTDSQGQKLIGGSSGVIISGSGTDNIEVYTDDKGYASFKLSTGDRAGEYIVRADFTGNTSGYKDFIITERKIFEMTVSSTSSNINPNPDYSSGAYTDDGRYITVTTNAYNFDINAVLSDLLRHEDDVNKTIDNWNNNFGFAWLNLDTLLPQPFNATGTETLMMSLTGSASLNQYQLPPLHIKLDNTTSAGGYTGNVIYRAGNIMF